MKKYLITVSSLALLAVVASCSGKMGDMNRMSESEVKKCMQACERRGTKMKLSSNDTREGCECVDSSGIEDFTVTIPGSEMGLDNTTDKNRSITKKNN